MRDIPLTQFAVEASGVYLAAVVSSAKGHACGLILTKQSTGRYPCRGRDCDPQDGYAGDILRDTAGYPISGVLVQYFSDSGAVMTQTVTDRGGRHSVSLPHGTYSYQYLLPTGPNSFAPSSGELQTVIVEQGHTLTWEEASFGDDADEVAEQATDMELNQATATATATARDIAFVSEELICDWHGEDGGPFSWNDIENTVIQLQNLIERGGGELRRVVAMGAGGLPFARPDMLASLVARGVWAQETGWKELQLAAAYRNFATIARSKMGSVQYHDRCDFQFRQVAFVGNEKRTDVESGIQRYLSDARVIAFTMAAQIAATEGEGTLHAHVMGEELLSDFWGDTQPQDAATSFAGIRKMFRLD